MLDKEEIATLRATLEKLQCGLVDVARELRTDLDGVDFIEMANYCAEWSRECSAAISMIDAA